VSIDAEAEGMTLQATTVHTDDRGWALLAAQPIGHVLQLVLHARTADRRTGEWGGGLLVAPGGAGVSLPFRVQQATPHTFEVTAPTKREYAYLEVQDAWGRAAAMAVALRGDASATSPRASFDLPKLAPGLYWLAVAGDFSGAESMGPSVRALPFFVAPSDAEAIALAPSVDGCAPARDPRDAQRAMGACLALVSPPAFERWLALEGFAARSARAAANRARGMQIAIGSVVIAAAAEVLLIVLGVREARRRMRAETELAAAREKSMPLRIVVGLLVALLGFGLLAALILRTA
jgi:hypothetical protein